MDSKKQDEWIKKRQAHKNYTSFQINQGISAGNRSSLAEAITIIESSHNVDRSIAFEIMNYCMPLSGNAIRIGITGVPGVGKSSFIEQIGILLVNKGKKVAVLSIDPSSEKNNGSILGDKTRMNQLAASELAFIRPSPSGNSLGGVARKTRETMLLCEAAGYEVIFIETVGVGQSETAVHAMVDMFLLLMLPNSGDELQGLKRGIMEMADGILVTKSDHDMHLQAEISKNHYKNALHLFPKNDANWAPFVNTCSILDDKTIEFAWNSIQQFISHTKQSNFFNSKRNYQLKHWFIDSFNESINQLVHEMCDQEKFENEKKVISLELSPYDAAEQLINQFIKKIQNGKNKL